MSDRFTRRFGQPPSVATSTERSSRGSRRRAEGPKQLLRSVSFPESGAKASDGHGERWRIEPENGPEGGVVVSTTRLSGGLEVF